MHMVKYIIDMFSPLKHYYTVKNGTFRVGLYENSVIKMGNSFLVFLKRFVYR